MHVLPDARVVSCCAERGMPSVVHCSQEQMWQVCCIPAHVVKSACTAAGSEDFSRLRSGIKLNFAAHKHSRLAQRNSIGDFAERRPEVHRVVGALVSTAHRDLGS